MCIDPRRTTVMRASKPVLLYEFLVSETRSPTVILGFRSNTLKYREQVNSSYEILLRQRALRILISAGSEDT